MDQLKRDKNIRLKIVHMGGSHVQGGIWSNTFSSNFQNENKTSGGGYFTFPYKIAKTNGQPYARSFQLENGNAAGLMEKNFVNLWACAH